MQVIDANGVVRTLPSPCRPDDQWYVPMLAAVPGARQVRLDRANEVPIREVIQEAVGAGFTHVILGLPAPYPAHLAQWVVDGEAPLDLWVGTHGGDRTVVGITGTKGKSTVTSFRLLPVAFTTVSFLPLPSLRRFGTAISRVPERY